MSSITSPEVISQIKDEKIQAAMRGVSMFDIASDQTREGMYIGSRLLNAHMLACERLRAEPDARLVDKPINLNRATTTVGKHLLRLVNQSLLRNGRAQHEYESGAYGSVDHCMDAEFNFVQAFGHTTRGEVLTHSKKRENRLFTDDTRRLVLVQKAVGLWSSISVRPIALNGIVYPPGMLFNIKERDAGSFRVAENVQVTPTDYISKIAPLRLSAFAFATAERAATFAVDGTENPWEALHYPETDNMSIEELVRPLLQSKGARILVSGGLS